MAIKKSDRNAVLEMYERWTREGFDCRTCAYTPCVPEMSSELRSLQEKVKQNVTKKKRLEQHKQGSVCTNIDADKLVSLGMDNISFYLTMTENEIKAAFSSAVYTSESLVKEKGMEVNVRMLLRQRIIHQLRPLIKTICYHVKFFWECWHLGLSLRRKW